MLYRITLILFLVSFLFNQSYFNRTNGQDIFQGDARSMAIGKTYMSTGSTSSLILSNPARLSHIDKNFLVDFQYSYNVFNERRSISVKDFFEGTLGYSDIVFNQSYMFNKSLGIIYKQNLTESINFGVAYSELPLVSFDYSYEEELPRLDIDNDGYTGIMDPYSGYFIYNSRGEINIKSLNVD